MSQKCYGKGSSYPPLAKGKLRLYSNRFCPFSKRVRLVLAHKKIPYETININLFEKPEWFLKLVESKVPLLNQEDVWVYDSAIIADYVDDIHSRHPLHHSDPYARARDKIALSNFSNISGFMYKLLYVLDEKLDKLIEDVWPTFTYYESEYQKRKAPFYGGKSPNMLDFMLWPWFETFTVATIVRDEASLDYLLPEDKFPGLRKWIENMMMVPAVQECQNPAATAAYLESLKRGKPDLDAGL